MVQLMQRDPGEHGANSQMQVDYGAGDQACWKSSKRGVWTWTMKGFLGTSKEFGLVKENASSS